MEIQPSAKLKAMQDRLREIDQYLELGKRLVPLLDTMPEVPEKVRKYVQHLQNYLEQQRHLHDYKTLQERLYGPIENRNVPISVLQRIEAEEREREQYYAKRGFTEEECLKYALDPPTHVFDTFDGVIAKFSVKIDRPEGHK